MRKRVAWFALLFTTLAASQAEVFEVEEHLDLSYYAGIDTDEDKHKLDLYLPRGEEDCPILIWIHGGAWALGGRREEADLGKRFAASGIGFAAISYRLSAGPFAEADQESTTRHPEHARDCARAVAWLYQNENRFRYDSEKLFISGYSAGGHLSALLVMDRRFLNEVVVPLSAIKGVVPISGAYDLVSYRKEISQSSGEAMAVAHVDGAFGGAAEGLREASPTSYIDTLQTPMLVFSDGALALYTKTFEKAFANAHRSDVSFIYYPNHDHGSLYRELAAAESPSRDTIAAFIREQLSARRGEG